MPRERAAAFFLLLLSVPAFALKTERISQTRVAGQLPVQVEVASSRAFVRFSSGTAPSLRSSVLAGIGAKLNREYSLLGWTAVGLPAGMTVTSGLQALRSLPNVIDVQPDYAYRALRTPNDPLFSSQYALAAVNAPAGWEYEVGYSSRVTIAVVDVGVDATQPDLSGKMTGLAHQYCDPGSTTDIQNDSTVEPACVPATPAPACDHATHVAGVAAASTDNGTEVAGLSWGAQILSLQVFNPADCTDTSCDGSFCATDDGAIANAINFAVSQENTAEYGRMVVNMSLGAPSTPCSGFLGSAIGAAIAANVVVVAAAGNDGSSVNSPGNCGGVIPMAATDSNNQIASFSSRGPELASGGLAAPGVSVLTTDLGGGTVGATGTSFASPMGAGLAALILSANPTLTPTQVQTMMRAGAQDIGQPSTVEGAGLMNVYRSLRLTTKGTLAGFDGDEKPIAFPNPFRLNLAPYVNFSFPASLQGSSTDIKIYTLDGQFVRELGEPLWDGKNASGNLVASGSYVFAVTTSKGTARGRLAVIR